MQAHENRRRQRLRHGRYRQRLSARGLVQVLGWVAPEQAEAIRQIMAGRGGEAHEGPQGQQREPGTRFSQNPA